MPRLADRSKLPNGGLRFYQAETNWAPTAHLSFDATVAEIVAHRQKNRYLIERHGWSTDPKQVAIELDSYNAKVCVEMNWRQYITSGEPPEAPQPRPPGGFTPGQMMSYLSPVKKLAAGAALLMDWEESGQPPVDHDLAERRAAICAVCPKNSTDEISAWFTVPVSSAIKSRLARLHDMKLTTSYDEKLNVCSVCLCPLRLKVHTPLNIIKKKLRPEVLAEFPPQCWIPNELAAAG